MPDQTHDSPDAVGRVLGTEDATPLSFWVAIAPEQYLQLDDVVVCERAVPGRDELVRLSGVVTQVRARQEGARFDSDVFLIADGVLPARGDRGRGSVDDPLRARGLRAAHPGFGSAPRGRATSATSRCSSTR